MGKAGRWGPSPHQTTAESVVGSGFGLRGLAIEANKHGGVAKHPFERTMFTRLVLAALDAAHGAAGGASARKGRAGLF